MPTRLRKGRLPPTLLLTSLLALAGCQSADETTPQAAPDAQQPAAAGGSGDAAGPDTPTDATTGGGAVVAERLAYAEVENELVYGHFVFPADMIDPLPAVLVIHDWYGLDDNVRQAADRLAAEGYIVLAVDLFGGETTTGNEVGRQLMVPVVDNPQAAEDNIRQAIDFLERTAGAPRVAVLGWSFGGGWALETAIRLPQRVDAVVVYYGQVSTDAARLQGLDAAVLGLFAGNDRSVTSATVDEFERVLGELQKDVDVRRYPDARHRFANPAQQGYDASTAANAWQAVVEFLDANLVAGDDG